MIPLNLSATRPRRSSDAPRLPSWPCARLRTASSPILISRPVCCSSLSAKRWAASPLTGPASSSASPAGSRRWSAAPCARSPLRPAPARSPSWKSRWPPPSGPDCRWRNPPAAWWWISAAVPPKWPLSRWAPSWPPAASAPPAMNSKRRSSPTSSANTMSSSATVPPRRSSWPSAPPPPTRAKSPTR